MSPLSSLSFLVLSLSFFFVLAVVGIFFRSGFSFGEEGDVAAVGGPVGFGVVAGLGELNERVGLGVRAVEIEVGAEDLPVPIGALGGDYNGIAVGRNFDCRVADGVEEVVEGEFGFGLGGGESGCEDESGDERADAWNSHRVPGTAKSRFLHYAFFPFGKGCSRRNDSISRLGSGLGVAEGFVEGLALVGGAYNDSPAVVIRVECYQGMIASIAGIESRADFVEGNPSPGEVDISVAAVFCDCDDGD